MLLSYLLISEKIEFVTKILLFLFITNLILNFSFINSKYNSHNKPNNIIQINNYCNNVNNLKEYNYLNYFFSANKRDLKTICNSLNTFLKKS